MIKLNNHNFSDSVVGSSSTMKDAMEKIGLSKLHILMIVDKHDKLIGTITDGDIRRSILKGLSMETKVLEIANLNPKYVKEGTDTKEIFSLMKKEGIGQIPILNQLNQIIDIAVDGNFMNNIEFLDNKAIILAGGKGVRLRPITYETPKPLIKIGNQPIIGTLINNLFKQGISKFSISLNYQKEKFYEYFQNNHKEANIDYLIEEKSLGTAGPLGKLPSFDNPYIVMNGDLLCKVNIRNMLLFHEENHADLTIGTKRIHEKIPYGVIKSKDGEFQNIDEKPSKNYNIVAGIYIFSNKLNLNFIENDKLDMPDLIQKLKNDNKKVILYPIEEYWIDIGNLTQLERAQLEFSDEF